MRLTVAIRRNRRCRLSMRDGSPRHQLDIGQHPTSRHRGNYNTLSIVAALASSRATDSCDCISMRATVAPKSHLVHIRQQLMRVPKSQRGQLRVANDIGMMATRPARPGTGNALIRERKTRRRPDHKPEVARYSMGFVNPGLDRQFRVIFRALIKAPMFRIRPERKNILSTSWTVKAAHSASSELRRESCPKID